jgi:hypothetical protein
MRDTQDQKLRELVVRLIDMAPEAPRFPEELMAKAVLSLQGAPKRRFNPLPVAAAVAVVVAAVVASVIVLGYGPSSSPATQPTTPLTSFAGTWVSTGDADGGTRTMTVVVAADGGADVLVLDDVAAACAGGPATMAGTGSIDAAARLVVARPTYACDDGTEPVPTDGVSFGEQLREWTLVFDPRSDSLTDSIGGLWLRQGATIDDPVTGEELLWPQASLEEVRVAQERADAGDPAYTWQLGGWDRWWQPAQHHPNDSEIFGRFLQEKLGWEGFLWDEAIAHREGLGAGDVVFIRCAAGLTNPFYPVDTVAGSCAPTIDGLRYETVSVTVAQLVRPDDASGIWVVTGWKSLEPFAQAAPPSAAETSAILDPFFRARIGGSGAEALSEIAEDLLAEERVDSTIPLLYATRAGSPYERAEFEVVDGPVWPTGVVRLETRLFTANDQTVVAQAFSLERDDTGRLHLLYEFLPEGPDGAFPGTTENGTAVPVEYRFLDGRVTYSAAHPSEPTDYYLSVDGETAWERSPDRTAITGTPFAGRRTIPLLFLLTDPRPVGPGCTQIPEPPLPADADALAQSILASPDFEATGPVPATIGGLAALQIDLVVKQTANWCWSGDDGGPSHHALFQGTPVSDDQLVRMYLVDLPGDPARILAIVILNADLDPALDMAAPIVESVEFHTP